MRRGRTNRSHTGISPAPTGPCVIDNPSKSTLVLCGKFINCTAIARTQGMTQSWVSYLVNGVYDGTMRNYIKIAGAIGVTLDELMAGIEERKRLRAEQDQQILDIYDKRIAVENNRDRTARNQGRIVKPRLPGTRID